MFRAASAVVLAALSMWLFSEPAFAEKRIALVIGNSAYKKVPPLANPARDADAMSEMFKNAGFNVVAARHDLGIAELRRVLRDFSDDARDADVVIVYYAGHGMEVDGINYLIPVDAVLERDIDAFDEAMPLDRVLTVIEPARQLRLVILDACRDNPFGKNMKRTLAARAVGRGLAKVEPVTPNTLIAFAAKAGFTATDGDDKNSPFTAALLKYLPRPGLDLRKAFGFVRDDVLKVTRNRQEPFIYGSLGGDDVALVPASPAVDTDKAAKDDYDLARQINVISAWDSFIGKYPSGFYSDLARAQRDKLAAAKAAAEEADRLAARKKALDDAKAAEAERARIAAQAKAAQDARILAEQAAAETAKAAEKAAEKATAKARIEEAARIARVVIESSGIGKETKSDGPAVSTVCAGASTRLESMSSRTAQALSQAEECGLSSRDVFTECRNCPDMVVVPAGEVVMGSSRADIDTGLAAANEGPQHKVAIRQPLAIGRFEVTRDQFAAFVTSSGYKAGDHCFTFEQNNPQDRANRSFLNPGYVQERNHPAVCVSWDDAKAYVAWLSQTTGKPYRLLSEAEFEYAARAGAASRFGFGNDPGEICKFANGADQSAKSAGLPGDASYMGCRDGYPFTAPVGSLAPNAFGLYDMIGNVWEWTEDCYYGDYATARADGAAHLNASCSTRTVRGGDWFSTEAALRPAARAKANADARHDDIGLRVARTLGN
ncbi:SUMF1/EgtB/PvdO family nonheme iron enzyme [Bradyrhizobium sp. NP1]|uniref:SUMF1/EgtB/PvdO family nonheme iron enzyme n=1 Tax=Bradyrhizobium sp. NP1 TaxID=3049772 RepID=UPI0025A638B6|nr:SUMF1/EgtB/PvdO family nonheme iron enzyme [Bradyrhizobium sp. NP1]WJR76349.1 SUMF1/EgtB/PvdO family nonheme iron enzyme [Bradyrhizobium sp. NP1]